MYIEIIDNQRYIGINIKPGKYEINLCEEGTIQQGRCWHGLLQEYWVSGCHSYNANNFNDLKDAVKYYLGAGVEEYQRTIGSDGKRLEYPITDYRLKSWADYTKKERKESIDRLIAEMHQAHVHSKKFYEILQGLEK